MSEISKIIVSTKLLNMLIPKQYSKGKEYVEISYKDGMLTIEGVDPFEVHSKDKNDWRYTVKAKSISNLARLNRMCGDQPIVIEVSEFNMVVTVAI